MASGLATAQAVVVHFGHVVVYQRIHVHILDGGHGLAQGFCFGCAQTRGRSHQQRTETLATAHTDVRHGFVQRVLACGSGGQIAFNGGFGLGLRGREPSREINRH